MGEIATAPQQPKKGQRSTDPGTVTPVLNNEERQHLIQLPGEKHLGGHVHGPLIILRTGWNFVPTKHWEIAKENPMVQWLMTEKIPPGRSPELNQECIGKYHLVERPPVTKDNPLAAISDDEAVAMVAEIFDERDLRKFLAQESRGRVAAALSGKIKLIRDAEAKKPSSAPAGTPV